MYPRVIPRACVHRLCYKQSNTPETLFDTAMYQVCELLVALLAGHPCISNLFFFIIIIIIIIIIFIIYISKHKHRIFMPLCGFACTCIHCFQYWLVCQIVARCACIGDSAVSSRDEYLFCCMLHTKVALPSQ